jgi:hypothetical protein
MRDISAPDDIHLWVAGGVLVCSGDPPDCVPEAAFGTISHWDGSTWIDTSISNVQFSSISMVSNTNGWAVGTEVVPVTHQQRSSIWHWDGTQWQDFPHPTIVYQAGSMHYILEEVAALDVATAWAATTGLNTFLRWNGSTWSLVNSPIGGRPSIAVNTPGDAWAVGDQGVIVHWDGAAWTRVPSPIGETLTGVSTSSVSDAWAVGRDGHILHGIGFQRYLPLIQK